MSNRSKYSFSIFLNGNRLFKNTFDLPFENLDLIKTWEFQDVLDCSQQKINNYLLRNNFSVKDYQNNNDDFVITMSEKLNKNKYYTIIFNQQKTVNYFEEVINDKKYYLHLSPPTYNKNVLFFGFIDETSLGKNHTKFKKIIGNEESSLWRDDENNLLQLNWLNDVLKIKVLNEKYIVSKNIDKTYLDINNISKLNVSDFDFINYSILLPIINKILSTKNYSYIEENSINTTENYINSYDRIFDYFEGNLNC